MIKTKCPFWHYGRGSKITCKYGTIIRYDYGTIEKMKLHRDKYCDSMSYNDCSIYKALTEETTK
jgi:hypothetical protein